MRSVAFILALCLAACSQGSDRAGGAPQAAATPAEPAASPAPSPAARRIVCNDGANGGFDNAKSCYYAACKQGNPEACRMAESFNGNLVPPDETPRLEGLTYREARRVILGLGWLPAEGACGGGGTAQSTCADFPEIGNCSGTGRGFCDMTFRRKDRCLTVVTTGGPPARSGHNDTTVDGVRFSGVPCLKDPGAE